MKYYLSAELLTYAKTTSTGGLHRPSQAHIINRTSELARIKNEIRGQESASGYGAFEKEEQQQIMIYIMPFIIVTIVTTEDN